MQEDAALQVEALNFGALLGRPGGVSIAGPAYIALHDDTAIIFEPGLIALAAQMSQMRAKVGLGVLRRGDGWLERPPHRVEDLRHTRPAAISVVVVARAHLRDIIDTIMPNPRDPVAHWRLVRAAAAAGLVLVSDTVIGDLVSAQGAPTKPAPATLGRIPIDLAGPNYEERPRDDLILIYGEIDASVSLYFDGLPAEAQARLRFLQPAGPAHDMPQLLAAALVVVVRAFEYLEISGTLDLMDTMGVPYVWFVDDNILKLSEDQEGFAYYSAQRIETFVTRTKGILASTPALSEALSTYARPVMVWSCTLDSALTGRTARNLGAERPMVLGVVGGSFRRASLEQHVLPALDRIDPSRSITLYARFDLLRGLAESRLRPMPMQPSFRQFIYAWRELNCDVLVHPAGVAANMPFKSPATLLVALYLGAAPVIADDPAYSEVGWSEGVCVTGPDPAEWASHLGNLAKAATREEALQRLEAWCRDQFSPDEAEQRLERLSHWMRPATPFERNRRLLAVMATWTDRHEYPLGAATTPATTILEPVRPSLASRVRWMSLKGLRTALIYTGTWSLVQFVRRRSL